MSSPNLKLDAETVARLREKASGDLYFFAKGILGMDLLTPHIHQPLCSLLADSHPRKLILLPRGWLKTSLATIAYPIWRAVQDPSIRILLVLNTLTNAKKKLAKIMELFEKRPLLRALWPEVLPGPRCQWNSEGACLTRPDAMEEATFECAGTGTRVTSRHYNVIVEDDTVSPDLDDMGLEALAPSPLEVEQAIGWHRLASPLLTGRASDQIIVVGTRWFEQDLLKWIMDNESDRYMVYERACRETNGRRDWSGPPSYPERFGETVLSELESTMGTYLFSALYMNDPKSSSDLSFRPEWLGVYETEPRNLTVFTTVDPAGDPSLNKGRTDYNAVVTTGKDPVTGCVYVLDAWHGKVNPGDLIREVFRQVETWRPSKVAVEGVAYQRTLRYWLGEEMKKQGRYFLVEELPQTRRSKESRIAGLIPLFANGAIFLRREHRALRAELLAFPLPQPHDDLADALSMHLALWPRTRGDVSDTARPGGTMPWSLDASLDSILPPEKEDPTLQPSLSPRSFMSGLVARHWAGLDNAPTSWYSHAPV